MEVIIELNYLIQVFFLHFVPGLAHLASRLREQNLVYHDVVDVDLELGQLLNQSFSFVHGQEFGNANCHKSCFQGVFHVLVHRFGSFTHTLHPTEDLIQSSIHFLLAPEDVPYFFKKRVKLLFEGEQLVEPLLQDAREVQESQCMSRGSSVEHDNLEVHFLN